MAPSRVQLMAAAAFAKRIVRSSGHSLSTPKMNAPRKTSPAPVVSMALTTNPGA